MTAEDQRTALIATLAQQSGTEPEDWFLLSKARHALLAVLAVLPEGEVVTQPLTCLTAVAPVLSAGHRPRYADIAADTLALDPAGLPALVGPRTRAVVVQHTLGAAAPVEQVRATVPPEVLVVEDSAHTLGVVSPAADVSVHSFGVEKMLPTRAGSAVWVNPATAGRPWHDAVREALRTLPEGDLRQGLAHRLSTPVRRVAGRLGAPGRAALRAGAGAGLVDLAIMPSELHGRVAGRPTRLSGPALAHAGAALPGLEAGRAHRRRIAEVYREGLSGAPGVVVPAALADPDLTLVRFPLLLDTPDRAERVFTALQSAGLVPGRWYRPLLFPGPADPAPFAYAAGDSPVAEDVSARILNLPTASFVTEADARRSVALVLAA